MSTKTPETDAAETLYNKWRLGTKSLSSTPEQRKFTIENIVPDGWGFARTLERRNAELVAELENYRPIAEAKGATKAISLLAQEQAKVAELTARIAELEANYKGAQAEIADAIGKAVKEHVARCNAEAALTEARKDGQRYLKAIQDCLDWANGRQYEWGERAENSFAFLENAVLPAPLPSPKETL